MFQQTMVCNKCGIEKPLSEFYKRCEGVGLYRRCCKKCKLEQDKKRYLAKKDEINQRRKKVYLLNKELISEKRKAKYREKKQYKDSIHQSNQKYREKHIEQCRENSRNWSKSNKEKRHEYYKLKCQDPFYVYKLNIRSSINNYLKAKGYSKNYRKTEDILGCSKLEFMKYIESKFEEGMSWQNHGEWHLDHILPMATAKTEEEALKLNHYTNFQPLWAIDNLKKGAKNV